MSKIIKEEFYRLIEFVALVWEKPRYYTVDDIASILKTGLKTVRRDASILKRMGIPIYSTKTLYCLDYLPDEVVDDLIYTYLTINKHDTIKNLSLIKKKFGTSVIMLFVRILNAISEKNMLELFYLKNTDKDEVRKHVTPVSLMKIDRTMFLICMDDDKPDRIRMFSLNKIKSLKILDRKSKVRKYPDTGEIFRHSWGSFTGGKLSTIELKFNKDIGSEIKNKFYNDTQEFIEMPDYVIMKLNINLSLEFVSWVMGWGDSVEVLKPRELKDIVIKRAEKIVKLYGGE